jgi:broad specificity phosphatase PhoE
MSSGVITRGGYMGLVDHTPHDPADGVDAGGWWSLTALGADVAQALAEQPEAKPEKAPAKRSAKRTAKSTKKAKATTVEVTLGPGESDAPHRHPGPVFGYVLEGEYEWAIDDQAAAKRASSRRSPRSLASPTTTPGVA